MDEIVITGADGFLGSHCVDAALARGLRVHAVCQYRPDGSIGLMEPYRERVTFYRVDLSDFRWICDPYGKYTLEELPVINCAAMVSVPHSYYMPGEYWPEAFNFGETVQSFDALIESFGGKNLGWAGEKENSSDVLLALFTIDGTDEGEPTHLMRQLSNGKWRTKMGPDWTLQIDDIGELAGGDYGDVAQFYSVPKDMWDQFRDYEE